MAETMKHLTTRVPADLLVALDEQAKRRRMETGDNVSRADLVREALESHLTGSRPVAEAGERSLLAQAIDCPNEKDSFVLVLEIIGQLAHDAQQRGLLSGSPQELGMAIFSACDGRTDTHLMLDYVSKLHGALRAV